MVEAKKLDELQEMAADGTLEAYIGTLGVSLVRKAPQTMPRIPYFEGKEFDRSTFDQAEYDEELRKAAKRR